VPPKNKPQPYAIRKKRYEPGEHRPEECSPLLSSQYKGSSRIIRQRGNGEIRKGKYKRPFSRPWKAPPQEKERRKNCLFSGEETHSRDRGRPKPRSEPDTKPNVSTREIVPRAQEKPQLRQAKKRERRGVLDLGKAGSDLERRSASYRMRRRS